MIFYFSGTGNSRWVAEQLAQRTGDTAVDIAPLLKRGPAAAFISKEERVGLVFPIYAWGAPKIVNEFAAGLSIEPGAYAFAVCTCGDDAGNAMGKLKKRFAWQAAWSIAMPNNYIPLYEVDPPALIKAKVEAAGRQLDEIAGAVNARAAGEQVHTGSMPGLKTGLVNPFFNAFAMGTKPFFSDASCTGCGLCERICPRNAIRIVQGRPQWVKKHCLQCQGCINRCPAEAIQYGGATRNRGRYYFKEA